MISLHRALILWPLFTTLVAFVFILLPAISVPIAHSIYFISWKYLDTGGELQYKWGLWGVCQTGSNGIVTNECTDSYWGYSIGIVNRLTGRELFVASFDHTRALGLLIPFSTVLTGISLIFCAIQSFRFWRASLRLSIQKGNVSQEYDCYVTTLPSQSQLPSYPPPPSPEQPRFRRPCLSSSSSSCSKFTHFRKSVLPYLEYITIALLSVALILLLVTLIFLSITYASAKSALHAASRSTDTEYNVTTGASVVLIILAPVLMMSSVAFEIIRHRQLGSYIRNDKASLDRDSRISSAISPIPQKHDELDNYPEFEDVGTKY